MSSDARAGRRGDLLVTVAVLATLVAALLPVLPMVRAGLWVLGAVVIAALVLIAGYLARRRGLPAVAVTLIEALVWVLFLTAFFLRDTAFAWVFPTLDTLRAVPDLIGAAMDEITVGAAPLDGTTALTFLIVGALGLLAMVVDHVVLTARMPLLASVGVIAVSLIPAVAVPGEIDVTAFALLALAILFLLRTETRARATPPVRAAERAVGVPATAVGIAAVALVVTLVATPVLPDPVTRTVAGVGAGPGIDASLQLGDDLRRPQEVEVLRVRSSASDAPYLRATTLSRFDGSVWLPDRVRSVPLDNGLGALGIAADIRTVDVATTVDVVNLASLWAPIPYPAVEIAGLEGDWAAVPYNRTVVAQSGSTQGQSYEVIASVPRPTLEQIRAREAGRGETFDDARELPGDLPPIVAELAAEVTAGATNDYDALVALQRWFRGGAFRYSLDAPVQDGFDGTGAEAVAEFLEVREGYCIHFASAFALMARTLDMPSRIVVGYLPGIPTQDRIEDQTVFSVSSSRLHAWPEVYFEGVGWVGFEPTTGLGTPTAFLPAASTPVTPGETVDPDDGPAPTSSATPTASPGDRLEDEDTPTAGSGTRTANPLPTVSIVLGILLLLAAPGLVREVRRRQLLAAAHAGDSAAAWSSVMDAAIDLGIALPSSESPRSLAARLVVEHGAPAAEMDVLLGAIERASYAPRRVADYWHGDAVTDATTTVRAALLAAAPPSRRILAVIVPRSLVVRPGSAYAAVRSRW